MPKFIVTEGIVTKDGKSYRVNDEVELNEDQAKRLEKVVTSKETQKALKDLDTGKKDVKDLDIEALKAEAEKQGVEVKGTGKNGTVKKSDYVEALSEEK